MAIRSPRLADGYSHWINTLWEDYGSCLDPTVATGLEEEIRSKRAIVAAGVDPSLSMGRIVVQASWRLAALVYLFMVLCGADSKDARVTNVHAKFVKMYTGAEARLPGPLKERKLIREMMLDLMERLQSNTFGNKVLEILDDI